MDEATLGQQRPSSDLKISEDFVTARPMGAKKASKWSWQT